ncbi:hypothetical protein [Candidatus Riesia pediculicola]|uniref:2-octaprenyl-6-methoxyphenyl hydroxylase, putative n=1 Tax=Riesia pediculicola (strain USDA) TaxID=515618 RepID=D4G7S9_RIEPU|nr:hypothetical protein [Candidatus Riesia pediculicola]ADD79810.1 2-octaprenyl-6-methoxyphenyl hydroxylase, putative [Candidatus Riesia pediculicola USDA]ARC53648.1 hypothetical protein AOE55_00550 [Candidatus Riesia pediculicola]QOJ86298.1 hypothetical protein ILQ01_00485 [Candidatus Riesia pediculicola]
MKIVIVGGGLSGISLTLFLNKFCKERLEISLVEMNYIEKYFSNQDRTIFLNHDTIQKFKKAKLFSSFQENIYPIRKIHISKKGCRNPLEFSAKDHFSSSIFGCTISLSNIRRNLFQKIQLNLNESIKLYCPDKVDSIEFYKNYVEVQLKSGKVLYSELLIVSCRININEDKRFMVKWSKIFEQYVVLSKFTVEKPFCGLSIERFTENGSLAILPIGKKLGSLIWCYDKRIKKDMENLDKIDFVKRVEEEIPLFNKLLGKIKDLDDRKIFPIYFSVPNKIESHRLVLIGSASQSLHPVAGQGFNLIVRDIYEFSKIIYKSIKKGEDIGSYKNLKRYQEKRELDRSNLIYITEFLSKVHNFSCRSFLFDSLLKAFSIAPNFLKKRLVQILCKEFRMI